MTVGWPIKRRCKANCRSRQVLVPESSPSGRSSQLYARRFLHSIRLRRRPSRRRRKETRDLWRWSCNNSECDIKPLLQKPCSSISAFLSVIPFWQSTTAGARSGQRVAVSECFSVSRTYSARRDVTIYGNRKPKRIPADETFVRLEDGKRRHASRYTMIICCVPVTRLRKKIGQRSATIYVAWLWRDLKKRMP